MNAIDQAKIEQESLARRTVRFDGGFVVRQREVHAGAYCWSPPSEAMMRKIEHWYEILFVRLARRLRYNSRKSRSARRRLMLHWGSEGVPSALAYCKDLAKEKEKESGS